MALPDLFSRRKRDAEGGGSDVYKYDEISRRLRVQIIQILVECIGHQGDQWIRSPGADIYLYVSSVLRKELGVFRLSDNVEDDCENELFKWFSTSKDTDRCLDFIELFCRIIDTIVRDSYHKFQNVSSAHPDNAISEINTRMKEDSFGYTYEEGRVIRIDSQMLHSEVVRPALSLLSSPRFLTANQEFLSAHAAFRRGDLEATIVECGKAFESTLKIIGEARRWQISTNDSASKLLDAAFKAGFIEPAIQAEFTALRALLQSGVPTVRNRQGAHGAGTVARQVPQELAAFQLHQTAAAILFLVEHDKAQP